VINLKLTHKEAEMLQTLLYASNTRQVVRDSNADKDQLETALCSIAERLHMQICAELMAPF
jgi:hypothetical protein